MLRGSCAGIGAIHHGTRCVEVLSPDDSASLQERIDDYAMIGFDPESRRVWAVANRKLVPFAGTHLNVPELATAFPVAEAFADVQAGEWLSRQHSLRKR